MVSSSLVPLQGDGTGARGWGGGVGVVRQSRYLVPHPSPHLINYIGVHSRDLALDICFHLFYLRGYGAAKGGYMTIFEAAQSAGLTTRTIRSYIYQGIINPRKVHHTSGAFKYDLSEEDLGRIAEIKADRLRLLSESRPGLYHYQMEQREVT